MKPVRVAVVGATGLVGKEFLKILEERHFPMSDLKLLASDRSAGSKMFFNHQELEVLELVPQALDHVELALFSAGTDVSRHYSPLATRKGAIVVDNSAAWRMDPRVPLVVPEVNALDLKRHRGIVANPNCSTIQMVTALWPLHQVNPIKRIIVDTYQSVSGTGATAVEELTSQARLVLDGKAATAHVYPHQIAFNLLPEIDLFLDNGYTREEWKMVEETKKIMHAKNLAISATCVRVPVLYAHSEAIHIELTRSMSPEEAHHILSEAPGVRVQDDPHESLYPQPWAAAGSDLVYVGRIRQDASIPNGLAMWVVADNLRKGAALNAIQIAEELLNNGWM